MLPLTPMQCEGLFFIGRLPVVAIKVKREKERALHVCTHLYEVQQCFPTSPPSRRRQFPHLIGSVFLSFFASSSSNVPKGIFSGREKGAHTHERQHKIKQERKKKEIESCSDSHRHNITYSSVDVAHYLQQVVCVTSSNSGAQEEKKEY